MSNIPKLRFSEFSDAWELNRLDNYCNKIASGKSKKNDNGEYFLYGSTGIIGRTNEYSNNGNYILIARVGANAGLTNRVSGKFGVTDNTLVLKMDNNTDINFILLLLHKYNLNRLIFGSGQPLITGGQLKSLKLNFPSKKEQEKIASFLSKVDTKIELLNNKGQSLLKYKKALIKKIFTQEIKFKKDDGSQYLDWEEKKLGAISDVRDGTHDSPKYHDSGYPLITSKNLLTTGMINFNNVNLILEEDYININKRSNVDIGDILFGMIGTIGNPVIVRNKGFAIKNVALIKENVNLLNIFLIQYLKSFFIKKQFYEQNTGGTQKFIALGVVRSLIVKLPCIEEQTKIANFLSSIDKKIEEAQKQIKDTKEFKKALLQQMFV